MRFTAQLEGRLVKRGEHGSLTTVSSVAEAEGVMFLCPGCYRKNQGAIGTHSILIWIAKRVPDAETPRARWQASGTNAGDLTLSPSINALGGEGCTGWHGWIRAGVCVDA